MVQVLVQVHERQADAQLWLLEARYNATAWSCNREGQNDHLSEHNGQCSSH